MIAEEKAMEYGSEFDEINYDYWDNDTLILDRAFSKAFLDGANWQAEQSGWRPISELTVDMVCPHSYILIKMATGRMMLRYVSNPTEVNSLKCKYLPCSMFKIIS